MNAERFIENKKEELLTVLEKLYQDPLLYKSMTKNALATYDEYSYSKLAERICGLNEHLKIWS